MEKVITEKNWRIVLNPNKVVGKVFMHATNNKTGRGISHYAKTEAGCLEHFRSVRRKLEPIPKGPSHNYSPNKLWLHRRTYREKG